MHVADAIAAKSEASGGGSGSGSGGSSKRAGRFTVRLLLHQSVAGAVVGPRGGIIRHVSA